MQLGNSLHGRREDQTKTRRLSVDSFVLVEQRVRLTRCRLRKMRDCFLRRINGCRPAIPTGRHSEGPPFQGAAIFSHFQQWQLTVRNTVRVRVSRLWQYRELFPATTLNDGFQNGGPFGMADRNILMSIEFRRVHNRVAAVLAQIKIRCSPVWCKCGPFPAWESQYCSYLNTDTKLSQIRHHQWTYFRNRASGFLRMPWSMPNCASCKLRNPDNTYT